MGHHNKKRSNYRQPRQPKRVSPHIKNHKKTSNTHHISDEGTRLKMMGKSKGYKAKKKIIK